MPFTHTPSPYDAHAPDKSPPQTPSVTDNSNANAAAAKTPGWGMGLFGMFSTTKKKKPVADAFARPTATHAVTHDSHRGQRVARLDLHKSPTASTASPMNGSARSPSLDKPKISTLWNPTLPLSNGNRVRIMPTTVNSCNGSSNKPWSGSNNNNSMESWWMEMAAATISLPFVAAAPSGERRLLLRIRIRIRMARRWWWQVDWP
jgi:hypothetical protein